MHGVETIVASHYEFVDVVDIAYFVVLTPVVGKLKFGLFWVSVFGKAEVVNDEGHVSTPFAEESQ